MQLKDLQNLQIHEIPDNKMSKGFTGAQCPCKTSNNFQAKAIRLETEHRIDLNGELFYNNWGLAPGNMNF